MIILNLWITKLSCVSQKITKVSVIILKKIKYRNKVRHFSHNKKQLLLKIGVKLKNQQKKFSKFPKLQNSTPEFFLSRHI